MPQIRKEGERPFKNERISGKPQGMGNGVGRHWKALETRRLHTQQLPNVQAGEEAAYKVPGESQGSEFKLQYVLKLGMVLCGPRRRGRRKQEDPGAG